MDGNPKSNGSGHAPGRTELLRPQKFHAELKRERLRTDRNGQSFAVVRFPSKSQSTGVQEQLIGHLASRLRQTDTLGWYDDTTIAVLLRSTEEQGGSRYVLDLENRFRGLRDYFRPEIHPYPSVNGFSNLESNRDFSYVPASIGQLFAPPIPLWKRVLDVTGAVAGLLLFSPLFLLYPVYLRIISPGPVFYRQERVGYRGRRFTFLKFRSMYVENSSSSHQGHLRELIRGDGPMQKLDDNRDPRIIPGGRVLRGTALDEVPQFLNVFKGEMSLVGPRPCLPYEAEEYLRWHAHRFDVLPGMSGLWQVSGKNRLSFKEMIRLDIAYCRRMSLWLDLRILASTFPSIFREAYLKLRQQAISRTSESSG